MCGQQSQQFLWLKHMRELNTREEFPPGYKGKGQDYVHIWRRLRKKSRTSI